MAAFARTELDLVGHRPAGQPGGRPAVRRPRRQARSAATSSCSTRPRGARRRGPARLPRAVLRARDVDPVADPRARPARPDDRAVLEAFLADAARRPGPPAGPAARREARAHGPRRRATRPRRSRASRPAGWPTRAGPSARCEELADALGLADPPMRIECYDISNFQGDRVGRAAWSCSRTASRASGEYRRFRIRTVQGPNDFASHQEVLRRRFRRAKAAARRGARRSSAGGCPTS